MTTTQHPQQHMGQQSHEATEDYTEISTSEGLCKVGVLERCRASQWAVAPIFYVVCHYAPTST